MSNLHKRGLHDVKGRENPLYSALKERGRLRSLVELVKNDDNITLEIRDNYINIYYQGGNVAKITSPNKVELDKNYFRQYEDIQKEDWSDIDNKEKEIINLFMHGKFKEYIKEVKTKMLNYWENVLKNKGVEEKKTQHQICLCNAFGKSDYTQLDVEYEVSRKSSFKYSGRRRTPTGKIPSPRFDIIAVRNKDHRLCIIELKKGTGALSNKSGVQEHAESYHNTIGKDAKTRKAFLDEMQGILEIKKKLKILPDNIDIDKNLDPEFLFAYQYSSSDGKHPTEESQKNNFLYYQNNTAYKLDDVNHAKGIKVLWLKEGDYTLIDN